MLAYMIFLHIPTNCWWMLLLACLLPFLLGLLLYALLRGRLQQRISDLQAENKNNHDHWTSIEKDFMTLKYEHEELKKELDRTKTSLRACEADSMILRGKLEQAMEHSHGDTEARALGFGGVAPSWDYSILFQPDNLQIIEGVGPKVEQLLKDAGIANWSELAAQTPESLSGLLENAGAAYRMMNPATWPQQAGLAAEGRWDELTELQKFLDTGREDKGDLQTPSKIENMALAILGFKNNPNDLKIVEGIGPKIEELLKNAGIRTWSDLAAAPAGRLQEILDQAGENYRLADPGTWPQQAGLAAEGRWQELKDLQDSLRGGKR